MYQSHTSSLTELWSLPRPAQGLNTNNNGNGNPATENISVLILLLNANRPGYGLNTEEYLEQEYHEARRLGEEGANCRLTYPRCPYGEGLLDIISLVDS